MLPVFKQPVKEACAGPTVEPGNEAALADAICNLVKETVKKRQKMGRAARDYVEKNCNYSYLALKFASTLNEVANKSGLGSQLK